jgi:hypothetical protein
MAEAALFDITEGWTKKIGPITLRNNGDPVDLTGLPIRLILRGKNGAEIIIPEEDIELLPQTGATLGQVYFIPPTTWRGTWYIFPTGEPQP